MTAILNFRIITNAVSITTKHKQNKMKLENLENRSYKNGTKIFIFYFLLSRYMLGFALYYISFGLYH